MIIPTPGRIVWFTPAVIPDENIDHIDKNAPLPAIVCHVHSDRLVNLVAFDSIGTPHRMINAPLLQDDDPPPERGFYARWMPYQIGQAKKHEGEK